MNILVYALIVLALTIGAIYIARVSGLDTRANGIPSILIGIVGIIALLGYLV